MVEQVRVWTADVSSPSCHGKTRPTGTATTVDAFADRVRQQYLFTPGGLSEAEREVVAEAIDGGYFQDDDAFRSVVDRVREHEGLNVDDFYGTWLLAYEGTEYLTDAEW
jgi:predicted DNA binding protein